MGSKKRDEISDEDIPSDFFDDFNRDDFMEGLSVVDSCDDKDGVKRLGSRSRIDSATVDGVNDLRELLQDGRDNAFDDHQERYERKYKKGRYAYDSHQRRSYDHRRESCNRMDNYIKPGSRRDLRKTNEAIRKDKQVKVKEYLSKHLDSIDDLKPPGTELDDFLNAPSTSSKRRIKSKSPSTYFRYPSREPKYRISPSRNYQHKHWSPREDYSSHHHNLRYSPPYRNNSPSRRSRRHYSPHYYPGQYSRHHYSPRRSPSYHRSKSNTRHRSPQRKYEQETREDHKDPFLYPNDTIPTRGRTSIPPTSEPYRGNKGEFDSNSTKTSYPAVTPGYSYVQNTYASIPYDYHGQNNLSNHSVVQHVPSINSCHTQVPAPIQTSALVSAPVSAFNNMGTSQDNQFDALAKLVIEGKISREDYLKLTPNKGTLLEKPVDTEVKTKVLKRCIEALNKLNKFDLPKKLLLYPEMIVEEKTPIAPKFCSPLKRRVSLEFEFMKTGGKKTAEQQNKRIIDSIISTIGLTDVLSRTKKMNTREVGVQTTKPFCEICLIRDSTKTYEAQTSTDLEQFTCSVHTQVLEQDLVSSKSVFTPTGGAVDSEPLSIAHLTPAQLVSQLAARAKTLKQSSASQQSQFRRNPGGNYGSNVDNYYSRRYK